MSEYKEKELSPGFKAELEITKLVDQGRGLARLPEGRVVFVEGALAGEKVLAEFVEVKKKYALARVEQVIESSGQRVEPACPHYAKCGGCDLMHLEHSAQLEAKESWARQALAGLVPENGWGETISSQPWAYRNRVRWQVEKGRLGFFQRGSHRLLQVNCCPVSNKALEQMLEPLAGALPAMAIPGPGQVEGLAGEDGRVFLCAYFFGERRGLRKEAAAWKRAALSLPGVAGVRLVLGRSLEPWPQGPESLAALSAPEGLSLATAPGVFCQTNFQINRRLLDLVGRAAGNGGGRRALDLYSGWGNLGLVLARQDWQVLAVENAPGCGETAAYLAGLNGLDAKLGFVQREAGDYLRRAARAGDQFDLVVLDPPRTGAKGLMPSLAALGAGRVIYVSCHLAALARDAGELVNNGYRPVEARVLDMFPQTSQVETVMVLDKA